ncbi:Uncharacterised protein [Burkholderia pseudomallei]|nr:Uncharacterised protein [Burkholderia pseudomallei]
MSKSKGKKASIERARKEIKPGTRRAADQICYGHYLEMIELAFKKDGMRGVIQTTLATIHEADALSGTAEEMGLGEELNRAITAYVLTQEFFPTMMQVIEKLDDDIEVLDAA